METYIAIQKTRGLYKLWWRERPSGRGSPKDSWAWFFDPLMTDGQMVPLPYRSPPYFSEYFTDHIKCHDTETRGENTIGDSIRKWFSRRSITNPRLGTLVAPPETDYGHPKSTVGPSPNKGVPLRRHGFVLALADYATQYPIHLFNKYFFNIAPIHCLLW